MRTRPGFVLADLMLAIILTVAMMSLLAVAATWRQRILLRAEHGRAATHLAESAIARLEQSKPMELPGVTVRPTTAPSPAGFVWVNVSAVVDGSTATLAALVPGGK